MNTPSHFLMTAALRKALPKLRMVRSAVLIGSVAPDLPLYLLTAGGLWYYRHLQGWPANRAARYIFGTLYFQDPVWIACHSVLHSPVSLIIGLMAVRLLDSRWKSIAVWLRWFLLACWLHCVVDVFTHYNDGPLLFWPFDWHLRFYSPISYWDRAHFGSQVAIFELFFDLALLGYLGGPWIVRRLTGGRQPLDG